MYDVGIIVARWAGHVGILLSELFSLTEASNISAGFLFSHIRMIYVHVTFHVYMYVHVYYVTSPDGSFIPLASNHSSTISLCTSDTGVQCSSSLNQSVWNLSMQMYIHIHF